MAAICPTLLTCGFCLNASCQLQHDTSNFCFTCNLPLNTAAAYNQHMQSQTHAQADSVSRWLKCVPCNRHYIRNTPTQASHENSGGHLRKIATYSTTSTDPPIVEIAAPPNFTRCEACNCPVASSTFTQHCRTQAHIDHQHVFGYRNALLQTQANQRGIEVSGSPDGLHLGIRPPTLVNVGSAPLTVWISRVGQTSVSLTHVRTSSSVGLRPGFQLCFTFTTVPTPVVLTPQSSIAVHVHFNPRGQRGHFEDRLELVFQESNGASFVITRPLKATVANEDVLALAPIEPYRRPRRARGRRNESKVIYGGEKPLSSVKYVRALEFEIMPDEMKKILQEGNIQEQVEKFRTKFMPDVLGFESFQKYWTSLVHAEHFQAILDLESFNMDDVNIEKLGGFYSLMIPGLAENRPSVMIGDRIKLHPHSMGEGVWFEGFVHDVFIASVLISFPNSFPYNPDALYDVKFMLNPVPFQRMLHAIQTTPKRPNILFPTPEDMAATTNPIQGDEEVELELCNKIIGSNVEQLQAVKRILQLPRGSPPFVVFGPPGTGKTVTIVECICQLLNDESKNRILACAPSNSAADLIAQRLIDLRGLQKTELFRMNAIWRPMKDFPPDLLEYSLRTGRHFNVWPLDVLNSYQVIVATCSSAALLYSFGVNQGAFTHIFVDEAGQGSEAEVMIPILTMAGPTTNVVLSGDPRQLGPVVRSPIARQLGMQTSYLQRLMASPTYDERTMRGISVAKILRNFRSHSAILNFPNQEFYGNELIPCAPENISSVFLGWNLLGTAGFPVIFEAVAGEDMREATSPSYFNPHEASVVKEYVQGLIPFIASTKNIGIVTPYRAQVKKIRKLLDDVKITDIDIGSVENFQGQERQVIIVSTVRSNRDLISYDLRHTLGFVASTQRLNVAITRAQALLIIVGDPQVLGLDMVWRRFMYYIYKSGGWKGAPFPWDPDANPEDAGVTSELAEQELIELLRRTSLHGANNGHDSPDELYHVGGSGN